MPRANRHFLPGHVWHITFNAAARSNRFSRSTATLRSNRWANIPVASMASSARRLPRIAVDELLWKQLDSSQQTLRVHMEDAL